ncbi:MAG: hypothetical protein FWD40_07660 [Treponema sp.]|nr:hypothetical protein [Treponema sp.]
MKKIICLVLYTCIISFVAFAQQQENRYTVTITYAGENGNILTETINILSTSAREAEEIATKQWEALKQADWEFKFANAERADESVPTLTPAPAQVVTPPTIGYLQVTNAHPWPTNINQTKMWVDKIYVRLSGSSAYELLHNSRINTDRAHTIALPTGIYDVKVEVFRNWFDQRVGDRVDTVEVETRNVVIRENMTTDASMRNASLSVSQPRR